MKEIDKKDKKILYELDIHARQPLSKIAGNIGTSKQVVEYRVNRLIRLGIIKGFFTVIDHSKLGYFSFRVYVKLRKISPEKQREMVAYLNKNKNIWWFVTVDGHYDLDFVILVKDVFAYYPIWEEILSLYKAYIYEHETVVYSHIQGFPKSYLIGKKNEEEGFLISFKREELELDLLDFQILRLMSINARIEIVELARQTKAAIKTVVQRIKSMEKRKIIVGYRALINLSKIGYRYYKMVFYLFDTHKIAMMSSWALMHPNIPYINKTIGGGDFELEIHAQGHDEFQKILNEFKSMFHESIDHYYYFMVNEEFKMIYFPTEGEE